jgi:hypothetical protein
MRTEPGPAVQPASSHVLPAAAAAPTASLVDRLAARTSRPVGARTSPDVTGTVRGTWEVRPLEAIAPAAPPAGQAGQRRAQALVDPAPALVRPPDARRRLPVAWSAHLGVALLAAHGGAGVSCLLRAGLSKVGAADAGGAWPAVGPVLLVARTSTHGLERARDAARQHASGAAGPGTQLLGLVLVADAPGRLPQRVSELADLVCGAFARTWQVPWLEEWRLATAAQTLPVHPEVARLRADLGTPPHRRSDCSDTPVHRDLTQARSSANEGELL